MSEQSNPPKLGLNTSESDEARMRLALGLRDGSTHDRTAQRGQPDRRARRFVRDGEVPVVVLNGVREHPGDAAPAGNRLAAVEAALATERSARERAERSLADALSTVQHLRTQLGHADLAHQEALQAERAGREAAETALSEAVAARDAAEQRFAAELAAQASVPELPLPPVAAPSVGPEQEERTPAKIKEAAKRVPRARRLSEPSSSEPEPEPVKWWLPSYRASRRKR